MNNDIGAGYGYRLLKEGEIIQKGDEFLRDGWEARTSAIGEAQTNDHYPTRRKIDVGEGYELVPEGETVLSGDQYLNTWDHWEDCITTIGQPAGIKVDGHDGAFFQAFRRKKPVAQPAKPEAGYGYILIDTEEKKRKYAPQQKGDEYLSHGGWSEVLVLVAEFCKCDIYRRKIDPGAGYEIVPEGQPTRVTDDYFNVNFGFERWQPFGCDEDTLIKEFSTAKVYWGIGAWRRKIEPRPAAVLGKPATNYSFTSITQWLDPRKQTPAPGSRIWFVSKGRVRLCTDYQGQLKDYTHWREVGEGEIPAPPPDWLKDEAEEAHEKWRNGLPFDDLIFGVMQKDAYLAGFKDGKAAR